MLDPLAPSIPPVPRASVSYGSSLNVVTVLLKRNPAAFLENVCLFGLVGERWLSSSCGKRSCVT